MLTLCRVASPGLDGDEILDAVNAWSRPGCSRGRLFFGPRTHRAAQRHFPPLYLDRDSTGVKLGAALEGVLDLGSEFRGGDAGFHRDQIADAHHARQIA